MLAWFWTMEIFHAVGVGVIAEGFGGVARRRWAVGQGSGGWCLTLLLTELTFDLRSRSLKLIGFHKLSCLYG